MKTTSGYRLQPTDHALHTIQAKGITADAVLRTWNAPATIYASRNHPGQYRITGHGLVLVGKPLGEEFVLITVYANVIETDLRADQTDPAALAYGAKKGRR